MNRATRVALTLSPLLVLVPVLWLHGPVEQDLAYHDFADQRTVAGIPHVGDVLTNLAFVIVGIWGLSLRPPTDYAVFFFGVLLTGIGSGYYHLSPDNATLAWDRAPMAVAFMGLLAALIRERVSPTWGRRLLWPLVFFGIWSVWYWAKTDDLRPYILTQYGTLMTVLMLLVVFPGPRWGFALAGLGYAAAKTAEILDRPVYEATGFASGHNLKHLFAALGSAAIVLMLMARRRDAASADADARLGA